MAVHRWTCLRCGIAYYWYIGFNTNRDMEEDIHRHLEKHREVSRQTTLLGKNVDDYMEVRTSRRIQKEAIDSEMKIGEIASKISFRRTPIITIDYDPTVEAVEKTGQGGNTYLQVQVKMDGRPALLPVSQNLLSKLQPFRTACKLKIERTGDGFTTDYTVTQVK
jgi:hypothetical protein